MNNLIEFFTNLNSEKTVDLIIAIGIVAVFYILSPLFSYAIIKIFNIKKNEKKIRQNAFYLPLKSFFRVLGIYIGLRYLKPVIGFSNNIMDWITKIFRIVVILTTATGLAHSFTKNSSIVKKFKEKSEKDVDDTTVIFCIRIIKVFIYVIAGFMIAADLGYDLSGIVTGLGLGSVVVTLAAQDTIKNLFGGLIIFLDKPFKVGDYIKFDTYEGTVEDVTFRSTKLRTLENSIAQIPNSEISSSTVVNLSKMQKRRYTLNLGLVLNTNLDKMKILEEQILDYLNNNAVVIDETANVSFSEIGSSDYNINIYCYLNVIDYKLFLKEKENINYGIMNIVHQNNVELAYETKTIEIKNEI